MKITKKSPLTGIDHTMDLPITQEQLDRWENGELIQQVFDDLSDSQREFLISGIYEDEWNMLGFDSDNDDAISDNLVFSEEEMAYIKELENAEQYDASLSSVANNTFAVMYQVRFKDIDPDTGYTSQDKLIAYAEEPVMADWIVAALKHYTMDVEHDPNREFYILKKPSI